MTRSPLHKARYPVSVLLGVAGLALAGAAAAQTDVGGITIYSRPPSISPYDDHPILSRGVSYSDLDLTTDAGVTELKWRVERAASEMCRELREGPEASQNTAVLPSCQAAARDSAAQQIDRAVSSARYAAAYRYSYPAYPAPDEAVTSAPAYPPPAYGYAPDYSAPAPSYDYYPPAP